MAWRARTKHGNVFTEYNGRKYHSKKEARYAQTLDLQVKAGTVLEWKPQVPMPLVVCDRKVGTCVVDFRVSYSDGRIAYQDVKGRMNGSDSASQLWRLKHAILAATGTPVEIV